MRLHFLFFLAILLSNTSISAHAEAPSCSIKPFVAPEADQEALNSGALGEWHSDLSQSFISITDLDQHQQDYFSLQKKPNTNEKIELIIFLHGFPEFSWAWENQISYFGEHMHAVALDLKGHHYSSAPEDVSEYDFVKLAWELRQIIHCLGYQKATLVGHDFGGGLAWAEGMLYPDSVNQLVILNAPHIYLLGRAFIKGDEKQLKRSKYMMSAQSDALFDQLFFYRTIFSDQSLFSNPFYSGRRGLRLVWESWLPVTRWNAMKRYYRAMPFPPTQHDFPEKWRGGLSEVYYIKRPTLVLWGMKDPYFGAELLDGLDQLVETLEVIEYPDATHWVNHEAPDLNEQIEKFMLTHP